MSVEAELKRPAFVKSRAGIMVRVLPFAAGKVTLWQRRRGLGECDLFKRVGNGFICGAEELATEDTESGEWGVGSGQHGSDAVLECGVRNREWEKGAGYGGHVCVRLLWVSS